jgi:hypothetical protein
MQKKFKHKKTGEIATYQDGVLKSSGFCVEIGVEPSSQFWEVISEKDFEIVLWSFGNEDRFKTKNPDGTAIKYNIHSVKRLSDGEIFTIGDKITGKSKYNCIINSIELNPNCSQIMFNRLDEGIDLINAKHIKQPLFTTEDGKEIFEGDYYHLVYFEKGIVGLPKGTDLFTVSKAHKAEPLGKDETWSTNCKFFSKKEKAEEYIILNKPCLSINDLLKIKNNIGYFGNTLIEKSKELVKSKL